MNEKCCMISIVVNGEYMIIKRVVGALFFFGKLYNLHDILIMSVIKESWYIMAYYTKSTGSKYGNVKTTVDGIVFDSLLEASHYRILKGLVEKGYVTRFDRQEKIILIKGFKRRNETHRAVTMLPDFTVYMPCGAKVYLESKGIETPDYKIKKKLLYHLYPNVCYVLVKSKDTTRILHLLEEEATHYDVDLCDVRVGSE